MNDVIEKAKNMVKELNEEIGLFSSLKDTKDFKNDFISLLKCFPQVLTLVQIFCGIQNESLIDGHYIILEKVKGKYVEKDYSFVPGDFDASKIFELFQTTETYKNINHVLATLESSVFDACVNYYSTFKE